MQYAVVACVAVAIASVVVAVAVVVAAVVAVVLAVVVVVAVVIAVFVRCCCCFPYSRTKSICKDKDKQYSCSLFVEVCENSFIITTKNKRCDQAFMINYC